MIPDTVPRFSILRLSLLGGLLAVSLTAHAQDVSVNPAFQHRPKATPVQSHAECTCRAMGADFVVGSEACINNARMRCVMDQNVTSWKRVEDACPLS